MTAILKRLSAWQQQLHPFRIDLVGDYAGRELFLIEGDSLLRLAFCDERIDMRDGFQLLHSIYVVESFLASLKKRGCNFHLAFFDENTYTSIPPGSVAISNSYKYLFSRSAIIRHLLYTSKSETETGGNSFRIFQFKSPDHDHFQQYLANTRPYFIMCHDSIDKGRKGVKFLLKRFIWRMVTAGYNVAWINTVEFRDSKVLTDIVQGGPMTRLKGKELQLYSRSIHKMFVESSSLDLKHDYEFPEIPINAAFSERELMAVASVSALFRNTDFGVTEASYAATFLLHIALLNHLSLPQRHLDYVPKTQTCSILEEIFKWIVIVSWHFLGCESYRRAATQLEPNIHDYIDGRLLKSLQRQLDSASVPFKSLSQPVLDDFARMSKAIEVISGHRILLPSQIDNATKYSNVLISSRQSANHSMKLAVLPFSNPTFDIFLSQIRLTIDSSTPVSEADSRNKPFHEISHWHSRQPLDTRLAVKSFPAWKRSTNKWRGGRARRLEHIHFSEMAKYAASLVGAKGKVLNPVVITNSPANLEPRTKQTSTTKPPYQAGGKEYSLNKRISKKEMIRAENSKKLSEKSDLTLQHIWQTLSREIPGVADERAKIIQLDQFLDKIDSKVSEKAYVLECEVRLYKIWVFQRIWARFCRSNARDDGYEVVARIFDEARKLLASKGLTKKIHQILTSVFESLDIPMPPRSTSDSLLGSSKLSFNTSWNGVVLGDIGLQMTSTEFQLLHCGPYMDRNMDSKPDPRVSFEPDGWQRKVLDEIDQNNSVFVVAPTSAGKTFISFYAMEKVLRSGDESVLVYVAPSKALVNQVAAEIMARFRKRYAHAGKSVWAIHTRDRRVGNATGCQILVTVPHVLQIMLLSPSNANSWSTRVKRIIFDEVHCIGQADDGAVWEQLLLLCPCPFIALSATVGNPEEFSSWMKSTQKLLGIKLKMIQHHHRYSDLRKIFYNPPETYSFTGLKVESGFPRLEGSSYFVPIHPIASLVDSSRGMPDDLALEPRDCLSLYRAMRKISTKDYFLGQNLDPEIFFAKSPVIRKVDVIKWETELKNELRHWMVSSGSPFDDIVRELMKNLVEAPSMTSQKNLIKKDSAEGSQVVDEDKNGKQSLEEAVETANNLPTLLKETLPLLDGLNSKNALPAILFSYDRAICEILCFDIVKQLIDAEEKWRKTDTEWNTTLRRWREHHDAKKTRAAKKQVKSTSRNPEGSKEDQIREQAAEGLKFFDTFCPNDPSPQFSFADNSKHSQAELMEDLSFLSLFTLPKLALSALRRGIGIHHSGLNRHYRNVVEVLFRKGYLRVVIATGSLSLGINMPCKTAVFAGDSIWLTALAFRQSSGRAGRRGFDNLGNVIFLGISLSKARRLISSRLPSLMGHFPITTSLVLRLFILLHDSKDSEYAKRAIGGLLSQPRLYLGGNTFKEQVLHHLRFSIEYLRRQDLLGPSGEPLNFAGLTGHLYYTENSSFAFHALLRSGFFHSLCANISTKPNETCMALMHTLAHLFGRRPCKRTDTNKLAPFPHDAAVILDKHNIKTLEIYTNYVKTFAAEHCKNTTDNILPFSHVLCGGQESTETSSTESIPIVPLLPVLARSSFVALSGLDDNFTSISDLTDTVRAGIFLERSAVPYLCTSDDIALNSYLLDFYRHGEVETLVKKNNIRKSDMWFLFNDFSLTVATIVTSLKNYIACERDDDALDVAGVGDIEDFKVTDKTSGLEDESDWDGLSEDEDDMDADWAMKEVGLTKVLRAFEVLKDTFDQKFKAMWA